MNSRQKHLMRRAVAEESKRFPEQLVRLSDEEVQAKVAGAPPHFVRPLEVWRSLRFMVQVFPAEGGPLERLTVQRTDRLGDNWLDGITWDDLQRLKRECGRGEAFAVEVFPADADIVNVANLRHLWVLPERLPFAWRDEK